MARQYGVVNDRYKLVYFYEPEFNYWELFDLKNDPHELRSIYNEANYSEVRSDLHRLLNQLRTKFKEPAEDPPESMIPRPKAARASGAEGRVVKRNIDCTSSVAVPMINRGNRRAPPNGDGSMKSWIVVLLLALLPHFISNAAAHVQAGLARGVHDPCIIKADGRYVIFSTGRGIRVWESKDLIQWKEIGRVFETRPEWTKNEIPNARGLWAPDISFFDGEFHLYYAVSTFGQNRSCIGLATNVTLDPKRPNYQWVDRGKVIESTSADNWNAIDPNIAFDEKKRVWLCFGSYWSGIKLCEIDRTTGKPASGYRLFDLAERRQEKSVEAPFIVHRRGYYYLFVSFDHCCRGAASDYKIMVGRSDSIQGPYSDKEGRSMLEGGGTLIAASNGGVRGPGHCAVLRDDDKDWLVYHFYNANDNGAPWLRIQPLSWTSDGWPALGEALAPHSEDSSTTRK